MRLRQIVAVLFVSLFALGMPQAGASEEVSLLGAALGRHYQAAVTEGERQLEGVWLVVQMVRKGKAVPRPSDVTMTMSFRVSDHSWLFTVETGERSFSEAGAWRLDGSRLVTKTEDGSKVERMRVRSVGAGVLELKKTDERLVLKKQAGQ